MHAEFKQVTFHIVVVWLYERRSQLIGVLVMVVLHSWLEGPLIWSTIIYCMLIYTIVFNVI